MRSPEFAGLSFHVGHPKWGELCDIPAEVLQEFPVKETYIMHAEAMGPLLALLKIPTVFANNGMFFFIDNMGALSCSVSGHSTAEDVADICFVHRA